MNIKLLARDIREALIDGVAWIPVYKIGNRWVYQIMYANDGDLQEGFTFDDEDMDLLKAIAHTDHKAICLNGEYNGIETDCTCKDIEELILYAYNMRLHQLSADFLDRFVREDSAMQTVVYISANEGKLQQVIEYASGDRVAIPIEKDGTIKFFDDSVLLKK